MPVHVGIPELVRLLQSRGTGVFLVSGGFRAIINPIADILGIPQDHVYANTILFKVEPLPARTITSYPCVRHRQRCPLQVTCAKTLPIYALAYDMGSTYAGLPQVMSYILLQS